MAEPEENSLLASAREYLRLGREKAKASAELQTAWDTFARRTNDHLCRLAARTRVPRDRREDVVQEVWEEILRSLPGFRGEDEVARWYGWLAEVVRTQGARVVRDLTRRSAVSLAELAVEVEDRRGRTSVRLEEAERLHELLGRWLGTLKKRDQFNAFLMRERYLGRRSVQDLAAEVGLNADAVSSRMRRMRKRFLMWLKARWR